MCLYRATVAWNRVGCVCKRALIDDAAWARVPGMSTGGSSRGSPITRPDREREIELDALTLLKTDHDKVKKLLAELESTTERGVKTREELFATIKGELTVHEAIEEEIFYPELKAHPKAKEIVLEGIEEHDVVNTLMGQLEDLPVDDETWGPKAKVMKENIEHHIEEEEGEMFAKARQVFDPSELDDLGERMTQRKQSAMEEFGVPSGR
jgi:hemerythrin-like domain-containing protein